MSLKLLFTAIAGALLLSLFAPLSSNAGELANAGPADRPLSSYFEKTEQYDFEPPHPGSYALPAVKNAPSGNVFDYRGFPTSLQQQMLDKISLVSFVYLHCNEEKGCPLAISTLYELFDGSAAVPELRKDVQLLMISFDPARDDFAAIEAFVYPLLADPEASKKLPWHVYTTENQQQLKPILNGFGQAINPDADNDVINHLLRMFLVDRTGQIRNIYGIGMIDPRLIMTDIETLLIEEASN